MITPFISFRKCRIELSGTVFFPSFSWDMNNGETWLITGPNGGGKSTLATAISGDLEIVPHDDGIYFNSFSGSIALVSFEKAATIIEEERARDDSDFVEGGIDPGRTARFFLSETMSGSDKSCYPEGMHLENDQTVQLCGITGILDRGLKYLSTVEIRRCLLCRALLSKPALLILDEPFDGLDADSRSIMSTLFSSMIKSESEKNNSFNSPKSKFATHILFLMDRYDMVPAEITHVLELTTESISFSGKREDFEKVYAVRKDSNKSRFSFQISGLEQQLVQAQKQGALSLSQSIQSKRSVLVEMKGVTVEWSGRKVLENVTWKLEKGEHWLIRGPNGSGKTTFLELITGDNPQVFRNEIYIFGSRRGSGETIWELKEKMGIVSYRLHLEYRSFGYMNLENILLSGIHDSIGLYQQCGEEERSLAAKWLALAGFEGKELILFRELSYGEQRAVLIARAAIKCPPILILDEPCHGLDEFHRTRVLALLQSIAESGTSTLLHVTHDPSEVLPCEKHILEFRPGQSPMYTVFPAETGSLDG